MVDLYHFCGFDFRRCTLTPIMYDTIELGLFFVVWRSSVKTVKIGPLENFLLSGIIMVIWLCIVVGVSLWSCVIAS